ncbi:MAG TPA: hypothetical protein ENJ56_00375, partial [Anaerolineae bacterium]|nr:hypothetical protein [Anaerolineae bacterium]
MSVQLNFLDYLAIMPELMLIALLFIVLGYKSFAKKPDGRTAGLITAWGVGLMLIVLAVLATVFWQDIAAYDSRVLGAGLNIPVLRWGSMIAADPIGVIFRFMFLVALMLTALLSLDTPALQHSEYFSLLIAATIGFNLMAVATDFVMLMIALETAGISLYLLAGYVTKDERSAEAGIKYFVYGAFATAIML